MRIEYEPDEQGSPVGRTVIVPDAARLPDRDVTLMGAYCRLEPLDADLHGRDLWEAFCDDAAGRTWTYLGIGPFDSFEDFHAHLAQSASGFDPFFYAIIDRSTGRAAGYASYLRIDPGARSIEVGWITYSPRLQRSRVATDTMFVMMRHAFETGYRRYEWKCNALNAPSIAAAHRLGFSFEGLFRQALVVKGRNRDTAWFSVIDSDWPQLREAFEQWLSPDNFDQAGIQRMRLSELTASVVVSRWPTLSVEAVVAD
jgi:RimJ/RimL family protein N-acetyltransferase